MDKVSEFDESMFEIINNPNLSEEVNDVLNKNIITDEDIEKYELNRKASVSIDEFCSILNTMLDDKDKVHVKEEVVDQLLSENAEK